MGYTGRRETATGWKMHTVVFDLDGTLADTAADLIEAANACFRGFGHDDVLDPVKDKATAFKGGRAMLRLGYSRVGQAMSEEDINDRYPVFLEHYGDVPDRQSFLYPGVADALGTLRAQGYRTAICTNKAESRARQLVARLGIPDLFGALIGADTLPVRKPDPLPYREAVRRTGGTVGASVFVGDTRTDLETARAAGVAFVLAAFGPEGDSLSRLSPDALLHRYDRLPDVVASLIGRP